MAKENIYNDDEQQYLQMMQGNIERMASNSANCKTWLVTIVAGFLAIGCGVEKLNGWIFLAAIPVLVFWYLDTFYLNLERGMRNRQRDFLNKANETGKSYSNALYNFSPLMVEKDDKDKGFKSTKNRVFSRSIAPLYVSLLIVIALIALVLNWERCLSTVQARTVKCTTSYMQKENQCLQRKKDANYQLKRRKQSNTSCKICRICTCEYTKSDI